MYKLHVTRERIRYGVSGNKGWAYVWEILDQNAVVRMRASEKCTFGRRAFEQDVKDVRNALGRCRLGTTSAHKGRSCVARIVQSSYNTFYWSVVPVGSEVSVCESLQFATREDCLLEGYSLYLAFDVTRNRGLMARNTRKGQGSALFWG